MPTATIDVILRDARLLRLQDGLVAWLVRVRVTALRLHLPRLEQALKEL